MQSNPTFPGRHAISKGLRRAPRSRVQRSGASADTQVALLCMSTRRHLVMLPIEVWQKAIQDALDQAAGLGSAEHDQPSSDSSALSYL